MKYDIKKCFFKLLSKSTHLRGTWVIIYFAKNIDHEHIFISVTHQISKKFQNIYNKNY